MSQTHPPPVDARHEAAAHAMARVRATSNCVADAATQKKSEAHLNAIISKEAASAPSLLEHVRLSPQKAMLCRESNNIHQSSLTGCGLNPVPAGTCGPS
jgi:hypothetical protein